MALIEGTDQVPFGLEVVSQSWKVMQSGFGTLAGTMLWTSCRQLRKSSDLIQHAAAAGAFCGESLSKYWKGTKQASLVDLHLPGGGKVDHDPQKPIIPRLRELPGFQNRDIKTLRCQYIKKACMEPTLIVGDSGWQSFAQYHAENPDWKPIIYIMEPEASFAKIMSGNGIANLCKTSWQTIMTAFCAETCDQKIEKTLQQLEQAGITFDAEHQALWQSTLDKGKFDQSVDGWVELGLPAPFGHSLKLQKHSLADAVQSQYHMRPLHGINESTHFGIQSSLMTQLVVPVPGDIVVVTISLNTATLQLPAGSNSLKPMATRHLKKYLISGASEYVKDAGGAARLE